MEVDGGNDMADEGEALSLLYYDGVSGLRQGIFVNVSLEKYELLTRFRATTQPAPSVAEGDFKTYFAFGYGMLARPEG